MHFFKQLLFGWLFGARGGGTISWKIALKISLSINIINLQLLLDLAYTQKVHFHPALYHDVAHHQAKNVNQ